MVQCEGIVSLAMPCLFTNCVDPVQTLHTAQLANIPLMGHQGPRSTQLNMKFFMLINVKMSTIVGILTYMSKKNSIIGLSKPVKTEFLDTFILMSI